MKNVFYKSAAMLCSLFLVIHSEAQPPGYQYVKQITILESQIPDGALLNNFPFLYTVTDPDLRTVGNGGKVRNGNGNDIIFYLFSCNTKLDHQLEEYDSTTGQLTAWVRIPFLSTTLNTDIYIFYGNDTVGSSSSTNAVWDATYSGVWHMNNNPGGAAPQILDGTSQGRNGTANGGMTVANRVAGKMGSALSFDEVNDHIRIPDFLYGQELTVSFWFNAPEVNGNSYQYMFSHGQWSMPNSLNVYIGENAISIPAEIPNRLMLKTVFRDSNDANNFDTLNAGNTWIDGNWHYYTLRIQDFGGASVYIDGILRTNYAVWGANTFDPVTDIFLGGREDLNAGRFFGGLMDETRISTVWRSSNWIRTEFNNQNDPSSFYTVSAEYAPNSACSILPLILNSFNAVRSGPYVRLTWDVENTINTTQYFVERSGNGHDWDLVGNILNTDAFIDSFPYKKESFYRIKYRSGSEIYTSYIRKVEADCCSDEIRIYPNPSSNGIFFISFPGMELPGEVILLDATGQFLQQMRIQKGNNGYYMLPLSQHFGKGVYLLKFKYRNRRHVRKIVVQ